MTECKIGDVVVLNSGGPLMVIATVPSSGLQYGRMKP